MDPVRFINKTGRATLLLATSQEKLRPIMAFMALRAHPCYWKILDDTEDSLQAKLDIVSLNDATYVYHLCGIYDKNTAKFIKTDLEIFVSTMDRTIIKMVDSCTLVQRR